MIIRDATYNQEDYIHDACLSIINQDYDSPIEIVISDDNSTDNTFLILKKIIDDYTGIHVIKLNKNPENLGLIGNINKAVSLTQGELIIYAAGDDIAYKHRVKTLVAHYMQQSNKNKIYLVHSCIKKIDHNSKYLSVVLPPITIRNPSCSQMVDQFALVIGATCLWHRDLFNVFGPIKYKNAFEDLVLAFRAALLNEYKGNYYIHDILVKYRVGGISDSKKPKDRLNRKKYEIKRSSLLLDVSKQRYDDAKLIGANHLLPMIEKYITVQEIQLKIYRREISFLEALKYGLNNKCLKSIFKPYSRILRRVV